MQETIQNLEKELEQLRVSHRTEISEIEEEQNKVSGKKKEPKRCNKRPSSLWLRVTNS